MGLAMLSHRGEEHTCLERVCAWLDRLGVPWLMSSLGYVAYDGVELSTEHPAFLPRLR